MGIRIGGERQHRDNLAEMLENLVPKFGLAREFVSRVHARQIFHDTYRRHRLDNPVQNAEKVHHPVAAQIVMSVRPQVFGGLCLFLRCRQFLGVGGVEGDRARRLVKAGVGSRAASVRFAQ